MKTYWWIEKSNGKLVGFGRRLFCDKVFEGGLPCLQRTKAEAKALCWLGDKPVKIKMVIF